jgi:hypothetical protein
VCVSRRHGIDKFVDAVAFDEGDGTAAKAGPRHPGTEAGGMALCQRDHRVELRPRDLEVIAEGSMALVHQSADFDNVTALEPSRRFRRPRVLADDVAGTLSGRGVELGAASRECGEVDVS